MRAVFRDPEGPRRWRAAPFLIAIALLFASIAFGSGWVFWGSLVAFAAAGLVPTTQRRARAVELVCRPGVVEIRRAWRRNQRLRARMLVGASTARTSNGVLLTLAHAGRSQPIDIEVSTEEEADQIRAALGIGHAGFGAIRWSTVGRRHWRSDFVLRLIALAGLAAIGGGAATESFGFVALGVLACFSLIPLVPLLADKPVKTIEMTPEGVELLTQRGVFRAPWSWLSDVSVDRDVVSFAMPEPHGQVHVDLRGTLAGGTGEDGCASLVAQIRDGADRARGHARPKDDAAPRLETLRRGTASVREWLGRLDAAGQMLSAMSGYRNHTLDTNDLWAVLEDPDADVELRTGAARVLRHAPEARVRIDAAVAAVRDETANRKIRVAVDQDADVAARLLEDVGTATRGAMRAKMTVSD